MGGPDPAPLETRNPARWGGVRVGCLGIVDEEASDAAGWWDVLPGRVRSQAGA